MEKNKKWEKELRIIINNAIKQNFEQLFLKGNDACKKELQNRIAKNDNNGKDGKDNT